MAAVRHVAGRVSHDLNNLLTPLLAYPQLVRRDLPPGAGSRELLDVMERTANDLAHVTNQLARFALVSVPPKDPIAVAGAVRDAVDAVGARAREQGVAMTLAIDDDPPAIRSLGVTQVSTIASVLLANACDAMPRGGRLTVSVRGAVVTAPIVAETGCVQPGRYAVLVVADTGEGIPDEVRGRIFDPFYTTRRGRAVRGAGLGLATLYALLRDAGGHVTVRSSGRGSTFTVYLPETPMAGATPPTSVSGDARTDAAAAGAATGGDKRRIMVCDDERVIVQLFHMMIASAMQGVDIDEARNGQEAVAQFKARRHDVIVMDLHMPVMDGQTAFREIERECKDNGWEMPVVIFCTGYAPPDGVRRIVDGGNRHELLLKPVTGAQLVGAVKSGLHV